MRWLRWANLGVAIAAGTIANLLGAVYAELEPETEWGPWTYVGLAWATSAMAFAAWLPKPLSTRILAAGGVASAAWFGYMLQFGAFNLAGHFLAAVFFAATAWVDARATDAGKPRVARCMARALWWLAVAGLLAAALHTAWHWATGNPGSGLRTPVVLLYATAVGAVALVALLAAKPTRGGPWMRTRALAATAVLAVLTPERYIDPNVGLLAAAAAFGGCSVALDFLRAPPADAAIMGTS